VAFYREHAELFATMHDYEIEQMKTAGLWLNGVADMTDDEVWDLCERQETARILVEERDVAELVDITGLDKQAREQAVAALAALVEPLAPGAATALRERSKRR
jgi:hypothetical protein